MYICNTSNNIQQLIFCIYIVPKLIENGYVKIAYPSDDLSFLTTVQLKEVLKFLSLKTSGKKQDLIERIQAHENIRDALKSLNLYKERFVLTSMGKETIEFLPQSITKNLELEDKCLSLIMEQNFSEAYKEICNWKRQKTYSRGIGIDWEREYTIGLDKLQVKNIFTFLGSRHFL